MMNKVKRILSLSFVAMLVVSVFSTTAYAANMSSCKWNTGYQYLNSDGTALGTNSFTIYGDISQNKVQIIRYSVPSTISLNDSHLHDVYDVAKFSVKIYKGSSLLKSYTIKLDGTFYIPAGLGTKYTVKITYIPPTTQSSDYKAACNLLNWYYYYKLMDI